MPQLGVHSEHAVHLKEASASSTCIFLAPGVTKMDWTPMSASLLWLGCVAPLPLCSALHMHCHSKLECLADEHCHFHVLERMLEATSVRHVAPPCLGGTFVFLSLYVH